MINLVFIVPLRNRDRHLALFTPYIINYISKYDEKIHLSSIIAVEQLKYDNNAFNRTSSLSNLYSNVSWIALHDVDWIPSYYPLSSHIQ